MNFTGKTAVLSGAASGMGLVFSENFASLGGNVVMADINAEALAEKVAHVNTIREGSAIGVVCDVRDYQQVCNVCDRAVEAFGSIDVVVNFAGGAELRVLGVKGLEFPDVPIDVYDWSLDVNLRAQLYFAHAAMKQMREQKSGVIINIGSITGEEGSHNNIGYATSKSAAMNGLTKSLAQYGSKYGIRVCCVAPGPVATRPGMAKMKTSVGRPAEPQEIIDLILYLVSEKGAFMTGINILADGGRNILFNKR